MDFNWVKKTYTSRGMADVTINKLDDKKREDIYSITFRNNSSQRITKSGHLIFCVNDNNRIYFRESGSKDGFKLGSPADDGKTLRTKFRADLNRFVGDYNLLWDSQNKLCFIDLSKKIKY